MEDVINVEEFIDEIEKRPSIWDMNSSDYSNKIIKKRHWQEIVALFGNDDDSDEMKKTRGVLLQKKWKSIRDNYTRALKKQKSMPSGSSAKQKNPYIHFNRLTFLETSVVNKQTESNMDENIENTQDALENDDIQKPIKEPRGKKIKLSPADKVITKILEKSLNNEKDKSGTKYDEDEDKLFCLSLCKELKKVPEDLRLKTKIDIYNLILKNQNLPLQGHQPVSPASYTQNWHNMQRAPANYSYTIGQYNYGYNTTMEPPSPAASNITTNSVESQSSEVLELFD